jgi:hypothetical protein
VPYKSNTGRGCFRKEWLPGYGFYRATHERIRFCISRKYKNKKNFDYWIDLCLEFNLQAKASKKKKKNT